MEPSQLVDLKALEGDTFGQYPRAWPASGKRPRPTLLQQYGDLETIYEHLDELKTRARNRLVEGREMAFLSRRLATIMRDLPIQLDLDACIGQDFVR